MENEPRDERPAAPEPPDDDATVLVPDPEETVLVPRGGGGGLPDDDTISVSAADDEDTVSISDVAGAVSVFDGGDDDGTADTDAEADTDADDDTVIVAEAEVGAESSEPRAASFADSIRTDSESGSLSGSWSGASPETIEPSAGTSGAFDTFETFAPSSETTRSMSAPTSSPSSSDAPEVADSTLPPGVVASAIARPAMTPVHGRRRGELRPAPVPSGFGGRPVVPAGPGAVESYRPRRLLPPPLRAESTAPAEPPRRLVGAVSVARRSRATSVAALVSFSASFLVLAGLVVWAVKELVGF